MSTAIVYIKRFAVARVSSPERGFFFCAPPSWLRTPAKPGLARLSAILASWSDFLCSRLDKESRSPKAGLWVYNNILTLSKTVYWSRTSKTKPCLRRRPFFAQSAAKKARKENASLTHRSRRSLPLHDQPRCETRGQKDDRSDITPKRLRTPAATTKWRFCHSAFYQHLQCHDKQEK